MHDTSDQLRIFLQVVPETRWDWFVGTEGPVSMDIRAMERVNALTIYPGHSVKSAPNLNSMGHRAAAVSNLHTGRTLMNF